MVTDILHDDGPLAGLTPVNVHRAVYTETIITRGAAGQLRVLLTHRVELQKPSYIYILIHTLRGECFKRAETFRLELERQDFKGQTSFTTR